MGRTWISRGHRAQKGAAVAGLLVTGLALGAACSSSSKPPAIGDTNPPDGGDNMEPHDDASSSTPEDSSPEEAATPEATTAQIDAGAVLIASASSGYAVGSICGNSTGLFWTSPNTMSQLGGVTEQPPTPGSAQVSIAAIGTEPIGIENLPLPQGIAADKSNNVYWVDTSNPGHVVQYNLISPGRSVWPAASAADTGAPPVESPLAIAVWNGVSNTDIFWVDYLAGTVNQASSTSGGGSFTVLAQNRVSPRAVATDGVNVYWVDYGTSTNGSINAVPIGGTSITSIAVNEDQPWDIVTDGKYVYWTDNGNPGSVKRAPIAGGAAPTVLASAQAAPYGIALDPAAQFVYWTNYDGGTVVKMAVDGSGPVITIATKQTNPAAIFVDTTDNVYWAAGSSIYRVAQ